MDVMKRAIFINLQHEATTIRNYSFFIALIPLTCEVELTYFIFAAGKAQSYGVNQQSP